MIKLNAQKLGKIGVRNIGNFKRIAEDFVTYGCEITEDSNDEKVKEFMTETLSLGMAMGEALVKRQYITIGIAVGVAGTGLTAHSYNKKNKKRQKEQIEIEKYNAFEKGYNAALKIDDVLESEED